MPTEPLDIFPLKTTTSQVMLVFVELPIDDYSSHTLFTFLHQNGITLSCMLEGPAGDERRNLILVISEEALLKVQKDLEALAKSLGATALLLETPVAVIRILGPHFDLRPGITGRLYERLARARITVLANSTTVTTSLLIVKQSEVEETHRALKTVFRPPKSR